MTSSKKKHHPRVVTPARPTPPEVKRASPTPAKPREPKAVWGIRILAGLAIILGVTMTLVGATPDILGGWGTLALMVPGMVIVAAGFIFIVETTPYARSKRRR